MISSPAAQLAPTPARIGPVRPGQRIEVIDALRGLAVLGIFLVNMGSFTGFRVPFEQLTPLDRATTSAIRFLAQAKFYPMFSFLFGWGMAIMMIRAEARGARFVPIYLRRLLVLLLIGVAHGILIWVGDILTAYAILGFPLLLFRRRGNRTLLVAAAICLLIPVLISTPGPGADFRNWWGEVTAPLRAGLDFGGQGGVYARGTYVEAVAYRAKEFRLSQANFPYWATHVFGMFLLGLYAGRRNLFGQVSQHLGFFRRVLWLGLAIGLPLNYLWVRVTADAGLVSPDLYDLATRGARTIGGSALSLAYIAGVVLLYRRETWRQQLTRLAPVGRLALSNYILQSLIGTLLFYGYGLGMYGELGPTLSLILTLIIFRGQITLSTWWAARYRFGPMEWLWRSLTYGRWQPLRLQVVAP